MNQRTNVIIDIEDEKLIEKPKKNGGSYFVQQAFLHEVERDGTPKRYPREFTIIAQKQSGSFVPYKKGTYTLSPQSIRVDRFNSLELGFPVLVPVQKAS